MVAKVVSAERTRTFSWKDPKESAGLVLMMPGLDFLRKIRDGEIPNPPITDTLDYELSEVEPGFVVFEIEPKEFHYNPIGSVHGGVALTLMDSAMSCAVQTMLPAGTGYTTLEIKLNFVRGVSAKTGRLRAEGKIVHSGARTAIAEGRLVGSDGKLYAHATTTCFILQPEKK
ncbi:MAG: PaaI family thioesterase [Xanthobacteraceae bacterium]|nr:PaaI family thioesterase [Xanthobacteraceae bacterium]MCW5675482.1 PaaI family thioesterase [Xanthobacteraceae bacterium]